jgi:FtsP/CotA-like multicopper oxidase with cupredoxin domain
MSEQAVARRGEKTGMTRRLTRAAVAATLCVTPALLVSDPSAALPTGAPKIGMVCTPGTVAGSTRTFNLVANTGYIDTPDGNSVFMWSYANGDAPDNGKFQSPGPVLCATQGETVVVTLHNTLPDPSSIVFPGQENVTATGGAAGLLASEAASGSTVTYTFTASQPGTYLYESGSDPAKQVEMGLYGALIVRPSAGAQYAYGTSTQFDQGREYLLLLSEIDPDLHHAVETGATYDVNSLRNRYFAINGREFPDTIQDNASGLLPNQPYGALVRIQPNTPTNTQPALIRMVNAGMLNHPFHPHGNHMSEIAQDGRVLQSPSGASASTEHFGETIGSGQTQDFLLRWDDVDHWSPSNPLPVQPPNYRDVTFKDANTWYSGSPYLGYKGTLPTGTNSQNICGEWYFPLHSHALNEFTNYDQGFGGMGTLMRVDPPGGCFAAPASVAIFNGTLKSGTVSALAGDDTSYYQVASKTTTTSPVVTDWYAGFTGLPLGAQNLRVTYKGKHCNGTTGTLCAALTTNLAQQTVKICNWTVGGAAGCSSATSAGWVTLAAPPAQPQGVGSTEPPAFTWAITGSPAAYIGTGTYRGQVRLLIHNQRTGTSATAAFTTWANLLSLTYDAP